MDELIILPTLHRTTLSFMGMPARKKVMASRMMQDRFLSFDTNGNINSWDAMSTRLLSSHKFTQKDYSGFTIHEFKSEALMIEKLKKLFGSQVVHSIEDQLNKSSDSEDSVVFDELEESEDEDEKAAAVEKQRSTRGVNKKDKTFKLGFYDYTLLRSIKPVEDHDKEAYFNDF